jgi:hypothetical protein
MAAGENRSPTLPMDTPHRIPTLSQPRAGPRGINQKYESRLAWHSYIPNLGFETQLQHSIAIASLTPHQKTPYLPLLSSSTTSLTMAYGRGGAGNLMQAEEARKRREAVDNILHFSYITVLISMCRTSKQQTPVSQQPQPLSPRETAFLPPLPPKDQHPKPCPQI